MATVNFSVPSEVKEAFDKTFAGENKSAVLAGLMRQAVEERKLRRRRDRAIEQLVGLRKRIRPVTERAVRAARSKGRP
jgi:hypothetical protein